MLAIDTNIRVRIAVADDREQALRARELVETQTVRVSATVLLEAEWVLRSLYRRKPDEIVRTLRSFIDLPNVVAENRDAARRALSWAKAGMDFADALPLSGAIDAEAFISFDRDLAKQAARLGAPEVRAP